MLPVLYPSTLSLANSAPASTGLLVFVIMVLMVIYTITLWRIMTSRLMDTGEKALWFAVITITSLIGIAIYWLAVWSGKTSDSRARQRLPTPRTSRDSERDSHPEQLGGIRLERGPSLPLDE
jgi:hypothetical protein